MFNLVGLGYGLRAVNSNANLTLLIAAERDELDICLFGEKDGKTLQIDFDSLSITEVKDLISFLNIRVAQMEKFKEKEYDNG